MMRQTRVIKKTAGATLTISEMGDVVVESATGVTITLPTYSDGLWFRIHNTGAGIVTVNNGSTNITTLKQYEQCTCVATSTAWYFSKGGGAMTKSEIEAVLTGEISSHSHAAVHEIPTGGTDGQVLKKDGTTDYVVTWGSVASGGNSIIAAFTTNRIVLGSDSSSFSLGISYDSSADQLLVYKDGAYLAGGTDYTVSGTTVSKPSGTWTAGTVFNVMVVAKDGMGVPVGGSAGQVLKKISSTDYDFEWDDVSGVPSGGTVGQVVTKNSSTEGDAVWRFPNRDRIYIPSGTPSAYDDEFDDGSISGNWTSVEKSGFESSWYEPSNVKGLSVVRPSTAGTWVLSCKLKSIDTLSAPFFIETAVRLGGRSFSYPMCGLVFTDGVTYGSGSQIVLPYVGNLNYSTLSRYTGFNARASYTDIAMTSHAPSDWVYLRLEFVSSNTFSAYWSIDGVAWYKTHSNASLTCTPTHMGIFVGSCDNSNYDILSQFAYFRVRSGNPSNG